ncbi:MAG: T9SS type A sorting domain-containing protein [Bacteroidota bacterium]
MKHVRFYILVLLCFGHFYLSAQCFPDRHSTTWFDGWVSCETSANPNSVYGETHWIMYDFGYGYVLNESKFWNANEPSHLDYGINEYHIDYSLDGSTWTNLGTYTMEQASGESTYEGNDGPDFEGTKARYLLLTPTSNYGGSCFGFSEMRIAITDPIEVIDEEDGFNAAVYPNPFINDVDVRIASLFENQPIEYALYDLLGRQILSSQFSLEDDVSTYTITLNGNSLAPGIYIFTLTQNDNQLSYKLIKDN